MPLKHKELDKKDDNSQYKEALRVAKLIGACNKKTMFTVPLVDKHQHMSLMQRTGLIACTLEFDTSAYPNLEYIAGTRMRIYPQNSQVEVDKIMLKLVNDLKSENSRSRTVSSKQGSKKIKLDESSSSLSLSNLPILSTKDGLRQCLLHVYDITSAPSIDTMKFIATDHPKSPVQRELLLEFCENMEVYERWVSSDLRTIRSLLDEYSDGAVSARKLLSHLHFIQPRQYSISSIKSVKRFKTEILVVQHKFGIEHIATNFRHMQYKTDATASPIEATAIKSIKEIEQMHQGTNKTAIANQPSYKSQFSLRSMGALVDSPISTHHVERVRSFSGPLAGKYAASAIGSAVQSKELDKEAERGHKQKHASNKQHASTRTLDSINYSTSAKEKPKPFNGLCSTYLLSLLPRKDYVTCEFVENPRFTLKGNRERPIMMVGQDIGLAAFRPFWQQRSLEHDRAQVFYTLFKDLAQKKFGEMHLVSVTGSKHQIEDLFKHEIIKMTRSKVLSSVQSINKAPFLKLLKDATSGAGGVVYVGSSASFDPGSNINYGPISPVPQHNLVSPASLIKPQELAQQQTIAHKTTDRPLTPNLNIQQDQVQQTQNLIQQPHQQKQPITDQGKVSSPAPQNQQQLIRIKDKELSELGIRMARLLVESNGCLYTTCDYHITQAIEILLIESLAKVLKTSRDKILPIIPRWKGKQSLPNDQTQANFLFTLENNYERSLLVQEMYESTL